MRELAGLSTDRASTALRGLIGEGRAERSTSKTHQDIPGLQACRSLMGMMGIVMGIPIIPIRRF